MSLRSVREDPKTQSEFGIARNLGVFGSWRDKIQVDAKGRYLTEAQRHGGIAISVCPVPP